MICPNCHAELAAGRPVCDHCGSVAAAAAPRLIPVDPLPGVPVLALTKPVMTIGRTKKNDVCIPHPSVSRVHAKICILAGECFIEDHESRHGVEVNHQKVRSHRLCENDLVQIGIYRFRFAEAQTAARPTSQPPAEDKYLRLLLDVTQLINSSLALQDVLEYVMDSVIRVSRAERGLLLLRNEAGELEFTVARNLDAAGLPAGRVAISYSTVERVQSTGISVVFTDTLRGDALVSSGSIRALGLRSVMCVPLKVQERLIGVIYVDSRKQAREFSQTDLRLLESLASHAAVAIEKSQIYEQLQRYSVSLEDQVRERTAALAEANEELQLAYTDLRRAQAQMVQAEKLAAIGRFAAGMAHEINSPLGVLSSNMDTIYRAACRLEELLRRVSDRAAPELQVAFQPQAEAFQEIHRASQTASARILSIINALKNFVALDQAERKPINVNEALEATLTLLASQMSNRIRVVKEYGTVPPLTCSPGRMNQVFMNVLLNAVQAIEGNGELRIRSEQQGEQLRVTIEDSGRGMSPDQLARVFDLGFTRKEGRVGAGLGLAMARQILQEHRGDIQIESEPGVRTRVHISLPIRGAFVPKDDFATAQRP